MVNLLLAATIAEGTVVIFATFIVAMLFRRYFIRRKPAALALSVAFMWWDFAIISLFICRLLAFLRDEGFLPAFAAGDIKTEDLGIMIGYGYSALSNVFIMVFVALVFSQSPMFRRTGMLIPLLIGALNGVTIGLLIGSTIDTFPQPEYQLMPTIYHLLLTIISFSALIIFTVRPLKYADYKWEKAGFRFIIVSGVFGILIYLSFAIDFMLGPGLLQVFDQGYTPMYFIAYVFAVVMISFAYMGYVMPKFIRDRYKEKPIE
jgi:hypothetical protein